MVPPTSVESSVTVSSTRWFGDSGGDLQYRLTVIASRAPSAPDTLWVVTLSEPCLVDIHDGDGSSSSSHQGLKSTAKWATSLENLLEDPEGVKRFRVCLFIVRWN